MVFIDETGKRVDGCDPEVSRAEVRERDVVRTWVVDAEEVSHEVVVAEYPETGGKDVEIVIESEETGHWETRLAATGEQVEFDAGEIPDDAPHGRDVVDVQRYVAVRPLTDEELSAARKEREGIERERAKAEERERAMDDVPGRVDALEAASDDVLLLVADMIGGAI